MIIINYINNFNGKYLKIIIIKVNDNFDTIKYLIC